MQLRPCCQLPIVAVTVLAVTLAFIEGIAAGLETFATNNRDFPEINELLQEVSEGGELEALRARLVGPSSEEYALQGFDKHPRYNGQVGQDKWVDEVFQKREGLFVLESGANDGRTHSNSLFLEVARRWDCLLVEANPFLADTVLSLHRKCHLLSGGLSITGAASSFPFLLAGPLGGIRSEMETDGRAKGEIAAGKPWMKGEQGSGKVVDVPCFPLRSIMQALNRTTIDYWSLDTEGSEAAILQATDFSHLEIGVMTVEHNGDAQKRAAVARTLSAHGVERVMRGGQDDYFASPEYFRRRGWKFPGVGAL